jgi:hypothetical protein
LRRWGHQGKWRASSGTYVYIGTQWAFYECTLCSTYPCTTKLSRLGSCISIPVRIQYDNLKALPWVGVLKLISSLHFASV